MSYTVVLPEELIYQMGNTVALQFDRLDEARQFAKAASKATGRAVEVQRSPKPYKIRIYFLEFGGKNNV